MYLGNKRKEGSKLYIIHTYIYIYIPIITKQSTIVLEDIGNSNNTITNLGQ